MRLIEAILQANQQWLSGDKSASVSHAEAANSLPLVALTCIDSRLNALLPHALGLADHEFVWLRNPGNIITGPISSTMRSLALAAAVKGGKEIAVIGHTDCLVCKTTMLALTDALKTLGVDRARLPDNLTEYFGLFASERQNVIKGVELIRGSSIIGSKTPVHGLLVDVQSGRVEWLVNGYETFATTGTEVKFEAKIGGKELFETKVSLPDFHVGDLKLPEIKIGSATIQVETTPVHAKAKEAAEKQTAVETRQPSAAPISWQTELRDLIHKAAQYRIIGRDMKEYGPVNGAKILEWIAEERINDQTPVQIHGSSNWQPLKTLIETLKTGRIPTPPPVLPGKKPLPGQKWPKR